MRPSFPALALALTLLAPPLAPAQGLFGRLAPVDRVAADPSADYSLAERHGPWLIMAATFSGEGAEQQARELVMELRTTYNLNAYVHDMQFDLTDETVGLGVDKYGAPLKMKYRKGNAVHEWAVLVGDFPSIDDPEAQRLLDQIKSLKPKALSTDGGRQTRQNLAAERSMQARLVERLRQSGSAGPMRTAFVTRNPKLPQEYFVPKGVDKFVEKINRGVPHSLLDCPGRYTIKIATFEGKAQLQGAASAMSTQAQRRKADAVDPLVEAAENALLLCEEMRRLGWEAYQFHDRYQSIVTVGSFDEVAQRGLDGSQTATREVMEIIRIFGAGYDTPSDPLQQAALPGQVKSRASEVEARFKQVYASQYGQVASGLHPKFARVPANSPDARVIPFDIHPHAIEAPKKSVSGSFAWWNK